MLIIFYLSGVEKNIVHLFKKKYLLAKHIILNNTLHDIDKESLLDNNLYDIINDRSDNILENKYLIVQSLNSANDNFIELMNFIIYMKETSNLNSNNIVVFILYMAYGHRIDSIKNFMIDNIKKNCNKIIALDINKPHANITNINIESTLYNFLNFKLKKKLDINIDKLIAVDYRSLEIVRVLAKKLKINYLFLNKHSKDDKLPNINSSEIVHIIDDVLYSGTTINSAINKCMRLGIKKINVYLTHKLSTGIDDVKYFVMNNHSQDTNDQLICWEEIFYQLKEYMKINR